ARIEKRMAGSHGVSESNEQTSYCAGCMEESALDSYCAHCGWSDAERPQVQENLPLHSVLKDRYYVGRALGRGGFGVTYLARDLLLSVKAVVKEYFPQGVCGRMTDRATVGSYDGEKQEQFQFGLSRFLNEAQSVARMDGHANIVSVKDFFQQNGTAYMVMGYVDGETLDAYLRRRERLPFGESVKILLQMMDGLAAAHRQGLLHRDVSPDNIMISRDGQVKLVDFGAARYAVGERSRNLSVILKPGYAPQEQ